MHEFRLDAPAEDGTRYRDHLEAAERQLPGSAIKFLKGPPLPEGAEFIWAWYLELSIGRGYAGMGQPLPLSSIEIWAWCQLRDIRLAPWQLRTLRLLDLNHIRSINHPTPFEEESES